MPAPKKINKKTAQLHLIYKVYRERMDALKERQKQIVTAFTKKLEHKKVQHLRDHIESM